MTIVDRDTCRVLSWDVVLQRTSEALQACLERASQATQYYSDAFPAYDTLYYGASYEMRADKFVYCYNHRQLAKRLFPKYSFHLIDFVYPLS